MPKVKAGEKETVQQAPWLRAAKNSGYCLQLIGWLSYESSGRNQRGTFWACESADCFTHTKRTLKSVDSRLGCMVVFICTASFRSHEI